MERREAIRLGAVFFAAGCGNPFSLPRQEPSDVRLQARPRAPTKTLAAGRNALGLGSTRDGFIYVPAPTPPGDLPLVVLLHGAGGNTNNFTGLGPMLDELGVVGLAVDSRSVTWDMIQGVWGDDVEFIDRALAHTFDRVPIDPARIALAGFSDGASYALSLGLPNGNLFTDILAWSPGFMEVPSRQGNPAIVVSHGTSDPVLPIDQASRLIVPQLRGWGYTVDFQEFAGGHTVPDSILRLSLETLKG